MLLLSVDWASRPAAAHPQESHPPSSFVHEAWTVAHGLPVNSINQLHQSHDGYIWAATFDGLVRFDGVRFTVFNAGNSDGLPSSRIIRISESHDGSLWLLTEARELVRFDRRTFTRFGPEEGVPGTALVLAASTGGVLWVGMSDGLGRVEGDRVMPVARERIKGPVTWIDAGADDGARVVSGGGAYHVLGDHATRIEPSLGAVHLVREDATGAVWLASGPSLHRSGGPLVEVLRLADERERFLDLLPAEDGVVWASTRFGVHRLDGAATVTEVDTRYRPFPLGARVLRGPDGGVWFASGDLVVREGRPAHRLGSADEPGDAPTAITTLLFDHEGSLWLGTFGAGLHRLNRSVFSVLSVEEGLAHRNVYPVYEAPSGDIWIGTAGGGVSRVRGDLVTSYGASEGGAPTLVGSILQDSRGLLWLGGTQSGLFRCSVAEALVCEAVTELPGARTVRALHEDRAGRIWVGSGEGVFRLEGLEWIELGVEAGGPSAPVRAFLETRDGALWMATNGGGLVRFADERIESMGLEHGLPSNLIRALHEDSGGHVWVGTEGHGLVRVAPRPDPAAAPELVVYRARDGLFDEVIHRILEDDDGRLWMSTNRGIFRANLSELHAFAEGRATRIHSTAYTERDGLRSREANGGVHGAGIRASDGRLWFPTQDGVAVIDPGAIEGAPPPPPVVVERVIAGDSAQVPPRAGVLTLGTDQRDVQIEYTAFSFLAPENIWFRYRLDPYDEGWVDAGRGRMARYTRVPPGRYTFHIQASDQDGRWDETAGTLELHVVPRFRETGPFKALVVLVLGVALYGVLRVRDRTMRLRARELARLVEERTAEVQVRELQLAAQNARLEAQAGQLAELDRAKSRFFQDVAHELRTPLTLTIGPLEDVRDQLDAGSGRQTAGALDMALRNARRLLRLVNQILDIARIESGRMQLHVRHSDLGALVRGIASEFAGVAHRRGIGLEIAAPSGPLPAVVDPDAMEKVLTNLLGNAFNHTPEGGDILVRVETAAVGQGREVALVTVEDAGPGIPPEHLPRVFERFYRGDGPGPAGAAGTGIGLALARELVELHGGRIEAGNRPEGGAVFSITLPLRPGEAHPVPPPEGQRGARQLPADVLEDGDLPPPSAPDAGWDDDADVTTLLVVDDNADLRAWVRGHFARRYRVLQAADGREALELARRRLPDLVVSDVMMPVMDGHELLEALRASRETDFIPVILLTAQAGRDQRLTGLGQGADDYVVKPFDMQELQARVDNLIASRRRLRERYASGPIELTPPDAVLAASDRTFLERVLAAIQENIADPGFGVAELASAAFADRSHLFRRTRQLLGEAPSDLIRRLRLEHAARLLAEEELSVAQVAYASGFNSTAYFCRAFRQARGLTPSAHRQRARQG